MTSQNQFDVVLLGHRTAKQILCKMAEQLCNVISNKNYKNLHDSQTICLNAIWLALGLFTCQITSILALLPHRNI